MPHTTLYYVDQETHQGKSLAAEEAVLKQNLIFRSQSARIKQVFLEEILLNYLIMQITRFLWQ